MRSIGTQSRQAIVCLLVFQLTFSAGFRAEELPKNAEITFDLKLGRVPTYKDPKGKTIPESVVRRKLFNFLLNTTSRSKEILKISPKDIEDGKVSLSTFSGRNQKVGLDEALNMSLVKELERKEEITYPYFCKNIDVNKTYRTDYLAALMMDNSLYRKLSDFPPTVQEFLKKFNVNTNAPNDIASSNNESIRAIVERARITVGGGPRVLEGEEQRGKLGRYVSRSYEFLPKARRFTTSKKDDRKNPLLNPHNFESEGGEFIVSLPNGFQGYFLSDANGKVVNPVPSNLVTNKSYKRVKTPSGMHNDPTLEFPFDCMNCHAGGLLGEPNVNAEDLIQELTRLKRITKEEAKKIREMYVAKIKEYDDFRDTASETFVDALKRADADILIKHKSSTIPAPVVADTAAVYLQDLNAEDMAQELGFRQEKQGGPSAGDQLVKELNRPINGPWRKRLGLEENFTKEDLTISRKLWASLFCDLKETLVRREALTPERDLSAPNQTGSGKKPAHGERPGDLPGSLRPSAVDPLTKPKERSFDDQLEDLHKLLDDADLNDPSDEERRLRDSLDDLLERQRQNSHRDQPSQGLNEPLPESPEEEEDPPRFRRPRPQKPEPKASGLPKEFSSEQLGQKIKIEREKAKDLIRTIVRTVPIGNVQRFEAAYDRQFKELESIKQSMKKNEDKIRETKDLIRDQNQRIKDIQSSLPNNPQQAQQLQRAYTKIRGRVQQLQLEVFSAESSTKRLRLRAKETLDRIQSPDLSNLSPLPPPPSGPNIFQPSSGFSPFGLFQNEGRRSSIGQPQRRRSPIPVIPRSGDR